MLGRSIRPTTRSVCPSNRVLLAGPQAQTKNRFFVLTSRRAFTTSPLIYNSHPETPNSPHHPPIQPYPKPRRNLLARGKTALKYTAYAGASSIIGLLLLGSAIFLHDAFTYTERHIDRVPVNPLALHPDRGGPKGLPVAKVLVGDEEDEVNKELSSKPRLVIVGGGWGVSEESSLMIG